MTTAVIDQTPLTHGQYRINRLLRTTATYRVVGWDDEHVVIEVVDAPNLVAGARFLLAKEAVAAMEVAERPPSSD